MSLWFIYAILKDGDRHLLFVREAGSFDLEEWTRGREKMLRLLNVKRIICEDMEVSCK